jgi:hypothetical protein
VGKSQDLVRLKGLGKLVIFIHVIGYNQKRNNDDNDNNNNNNKHDSVVCLLKKGWKAALVHKLRNDIV